MRPGGALKSHSGSVQARGQQKQPGSKYLRLCRPFTVSVEYSSSFVNRLKLQKSLWQYPNRLQAWFTNHHIPAPFLSSGLTPWVSGVTPQIYTEPFDIPPAYGDFLRTFICKISSPPPHQGKEITASSTRRRTNLSLGIPPNPQAQFIPSSCMPAVSIQSQAMLPPWRQHFLAHYLSLIGSNFLHDNFHIKNILGWHLRSAHSLCAKKFLTCFQRETTSRQFQVPSVCNSTRDL